jgi:predicted O-linked N-acetylglucosamine transferase (SPINDLY family)
MDVEDWSGAVAAAERFVAETPDRASSLVALASAMLNADRVADAAATARRAVELEPGGAGGHLVLGTALERGNDYRGASEAYARCADLRPTEPELRVRLAVALSRQGRLGEAAEQFRRATELVPRDSRVKANLAGVLGEMGRLKEAATIAEENAAAHPTDPGALTQAAILLNRLGESSRAETYYRRAIEAAPDDGSCAGNYAALLVQTARLPEALGLYRLALAAEPGLPTIHSGMLLFMNADPATSPNELFAEHVKWAQVHAGHLPAPPPHANEPSPYRRLRIGYLSQDWRGHSVAFFMEPLLSAHDRKNYEIVVYDDVTAPDQITLHLAGHVDYWNRVVGLDHEKLAGRIREDRIDVLVDLAGHTGNNRLLTLARKPAPVQVTYLGYPNTTGLTAVDYRITDAIADPPGVTDRYYTERLVRLPRLFLSFRPPGGSPDVTDRPSDSDGRIRFAAFNAPWKLHPGVIEAWCRVLRAVPGSRLLMKGSGLGDRATRQRFLDLFESFGVSADRVEVVAWTPTYAAHMGLYNRCDIALDTFPYNGTTTTCEALWMGVPVVTFEGAVHAGRVGATLLRSVGLQGLVAEDVEGYVRAAARLATDRSELDRIRRGLRERMRMSPLMDANGLARAVEGAYRRMWWDWCARRS